MISLKISSFAEVEREIMRRVEAVPEAVATEAKKIIQDNSAAGDDIKGRKMKKYSKPYEEWRAKHGLPAEPVTLRVKGNLLDRQKVTATGMKSSLTPYPDDLQKAEGIMKDRKFYPENESDILPSFNARLAKAGEDAMSERK